MMPRLKVVWFAIRHGLFSVASSPLKITLSDECIVNVKRLPLGLPRSVRFGSFVYVGPTMKSPSPSGPTSGGMPPEPPAPPPAAPPLPPPLPLAAPPALLPAALTPPALLPALAPPPAMAVMSGNAPAAPPALVPDALMLVSAASLLQAPSVDPRAPSAN